MAYIAQSPAKAQIELSKTFVHGPAQRGVTNVNALLVSQTLIAEARQKAGFIQPRPSAPSAMYMLPDGSLTTNKSWRKEYDATGFGGND